MRSWLFVDWRIIGIERVVFLTDRAWQIVWCGGEVRCCRWKGNRLVLFCFSLDFLLFKRLLHYDLCFSWFLFLFTRVPDTIFYILVRNLLVFRCYLGNGHIWRLNFSLIVFLLSFNQFVFIPFKRIEPDIGLSVSHGFGIRCLNNRPVVDTGLKVILLVLFVRVNVQGWCWNYSEVFGIVGRAPWQYPAQVIANCSLRLILSLFDVFLLRLTRCELANAWVEHLDCFSWFVYALVRRAVLDDDLFGIWERVCGVVLVLGWESILYAIFSSWNWALWLVTDNLDIINGSRILLWLDRTEWKLSVALWAFCGIDQIFLRTDVDWLLFRYRNMPVFSDHCLLVKCWSNCSFAILLWCLRKNYALNWNEFDLVQLFQSILKL